MSPTEYAQQVNRFPHASEFLWAFQRESDARESGQAIAAWALGSIIDRRERIRMSLIERGIVA